MKCGKQFIRILMSLVLTIGAFGFASSLLPAETIAAASISDEQLILEPHETYKLKMINAGKKEIKWSSSDKSVATVSKKGKVKAKAEGSAVINAKIGAKTYICNVYVAIDPGITIEEPEISMIIGDTRTITPVVTPENLNDKWIWSHNEHIDSKKDGNKLFIKAVSSGETIINFRLGKELAKCKVVVKGASFEYPDLPLTTSYLYKDETYSITDMWVTATDGGSYLFGVKLHVSGIKIHGSDTVSSSPHISFKVYDESNNVVASGTCTGPAVAKGEGFKDADGYISGGEFPYGRYRIVILDTE